MSDDLQKFIKDREDQLKSSKKNIEDINKDKQNGLMNKNEGKLSKWWRSKQEEREKSANDGCSPIYERMIKDMMEDHLKETRFNSSVVVINSFDQQRGDIQEILE